VGSVCLEKRENLALSWSEVIKFVPISFLQLVLLSHSNISLSNELSWWIGSGKVQMLQWQRRDLAEMK
jgi:hypothetical protein